MSSITLAVTLTVHAVQAADENEAVLRERAALVTECIRAAMHEAPEADATTAWEFSIAQLEHLYLVASASADGDDETYGVFSSTAKAEEFIRAEFDPESDPEEEHQPYIGSVPFDPTPVQREFVTVWHTCIDIKTGEFSAKGIPDRWDASDAGNSSDCEKVTPTTYNLGYANVYSRISAEDSILRAQALRERELAKQPA